MSLAKAPRPRARLWQRPARGARHRRRLWLPVLLATVALSGQGRADVTGARYAEPTTRYPHGVLGDTVEYGALILETAGGRRILRLPEDRVFEDTAPRLVDVTGDGMAEVVVVESDAARGARLAIYTSEGLLAATPFIGTRFRWLAPIAVADLDGDGAVELAYIDRPHLAKILRVWRFENGALREVASQPGLTNHRIGETDIAGGLRQCGDGPELVVATDDWQSIVAVRLREGQLSQRRLGPHEGRQSFAVALECRL